MIQRTQSQFWAAMSAIAIAIALIGIALRVPAVLQAVFAPKLGTDPTVDTIKNYVANHETSVATYAGRFDGRSLFFKPRAPIVKRPEPDRSVDVSVDMTPPPPTAPASYSGPPIVGVVGDTVWFKKGVKVRLGEEGNGITVLSLEGVPWEVRLGHLGGEYDVKVFSRTVTDGLQPDPMPESNFPNVAAAGTTGPVRQ